MIRDLSVIKLGEIDKCVTCETGWGNQATFVDDGGHLMEETTSCQDDCPYYKPPLIQTPDDYEVYKVRKNIYGLRPIYKE